MEEEGKEFFFSIDDAESIVYPHGEKKNHTIHKNQFYIDCGYKYDK